MLTIYRRHRKNCKQKAEGREYRRCLCPIWVDGSLNGVEMRKSLRLRDWQRAQDLVRQWEADGKLIEKPTPLTLKEGCDKFIADAEARNLREPTLYKYRLLFRQLQDFASANRLPFIPTSTLTGSVGSVLPGKIRILRRARSSKRSARSSGSCMKVVGFTRIPQYI
jgi:hypothetical protein